MVLKIKMGNGHFAILLAAQSLILSLLEIWF